MDIWLHSSKVILVKHYYKLGIFRENFIFTYSVKRHICHVVSPPVSGIYEEFKLIEKSNQTINSNT